MNRGQKQKSAPNQFDIGSHGGCEASLFEFRDEHMRSTDEGPDKPPPVPELQIVRIAARRLDEALEYLRWHKPHFEIVSVQNLGLILMISGSPVD